MTLPADLSFGVGAADFLSGCRAEMVGKAVLTHEDAVGDIRRGMVVHAAASAEILGQTFEEAHLEDGLGLLHQVALAAVARYADTGGLCVWHRRCEAQVRNVDSRLVVAGRAGVAQLCVRNDGRSAIEGTAGCAGEGCAFHGVFFARDRNF